MALSVQLAPGITWRTPEQTLLTIQSGSIVICVVVCTAAVIALQFVLVPLSLAYFVTFLMAPLMDMMEKRPYDGVPKMVMCKNKYADDDWWGHDGESYFEKLEIDYDKEGEWKFPEDRAGRKRMTQQEWDAAKDRAALEGVNQVIVDCTTAVKFPHMIACVLTLIIWAYGAKATIGLLVFNYEQFSIQERDSACMNSMVEGADGKLVPQWSAGPPNIGENMGAWNAAIFPPDRDDILVKGEWTSVPTKPLDCDFGCTRSVITPVEVSGNPYALSDANPEHDYLVAPWENFDDCRCCITANVKSDYLPVGAIDPVTETTVEEANTVLDKTTGDVSIGFMMTNLLNDIVDTLKTDFGVVIYRELICPKKNLEMVNVTAYQNADGSTEFQFRGVEQLRDQQVSWEEKTNDCYLDTVFPQNKEGQTWAEFTAGLSVFGVIIQDGILVLMLAVFILLERPEGRTIQGDHVMMAKIEDMIKSYIALKTALSFVTGLLVAIALEACNVKMGIIFGFLSFLLNFIPSVGSMIAIVLPIPIIVLDDNVSSVTMAIGLPSAVQAYVGNVLEPAVFGSSLNITAMAVLLGLVFFGALWGLPGAVLSVPLLGAIKIVLHHTDHPIAKYFLMMIREDASIP